MVTQHADDRHYVVELGIMGKTYTAEVWRDSANDWVLLSVTIQSGARDAAPQTAHRTLESALLAAEEIAEELIAR